MNALFALDKSVFFFFNRTIANPVLDAVMPFITNERHWTPPIVIALLALVLFGGRYGRVTVVLAVLVIAFSDQIVNFVLKPLVGRERPCFVLEHVRLLIHQPHSRSFPSSHAANSAAMAALFSARYPKWTPVLVCSALLVGISRIVVGVHYPSDVAVGFILGTSFALGILHVWKKAGEWIDGRFRRRGRRGSDRTVS
jgi:undecaprenyl-diphosphatase